MGSEMCIRDSLIVCPTGTNVYGFKSQLPDFDGVERVSVDTIQGVLKYKRPGADSQVAWAPPSALRRIDVLLCDEASQYEDVDWSRFFISVREQPHKPYTVVVADFQQLQPVSSGGLCRKHCTGINAEGVKVANGMGNKVTLKTVYRTSDEAHLLFLNRIREQQPDRDCLDAYFGDRFWSKTGRTLEECVEYGMELAAAVGPSEVFTWLTTTNKGAEEVCEAALLNKGITRAQCNDGYACDPASKSTLGILAIVGIILRLTRNLDKSLGFVN